MTQLRNQKGSQVTSYEYDFGNELFNVTLFQDLTGTAEKIGDYTINGTKEKVGDTFIRNIFSISTKNKSVEGFKNLVSSIELEATTAGATRIQIGGYAIFNSGLLSPRIASRFGYILKIIDNSTIILKKGF